MAEHMDPEQLVPSGIDSIVHDLVKFGTDHEFALVGVSASRQPGRWTSVEFAGRTIRFLPVIRLDRSSPHGLARVLPHSFLFVWGLWRHRRKLSAELLHVHRVETGFASGRLIRAPYIQFIHNDSKGLLGKDSDSFWKRLPLVYRWLERGTVLRSRRVVIFNETDSPRLREMRPDLVTSKTWFDPAIFFDRAPGIKKQLTGADRISVSWVGRLDTQKDPLLAVEVLKNLRASGVDARLIMIGSGRLESEIRTTVDAQNLSAFVDLVGAVSRDEVAERVAKSTVMLMTSHYEGSPTVLVEAGALGVPVVGTEGADPDLVLIRGRNGIRVSSRAPGDLAAAIQEAVNYAREECFASSSARSASTIVPRLLQL